MTETITSYCRMCPASCGVRVTVDNGAAVRLAGDRDHPVSRGYVCPKGRRMIDIVDDPAVLDEPLMRDPQGTLVQVDWDTALGDLAERLSLIQERYEPDRGGAGPFVAFPGTRGSSRGVQRPAALAG
jgi:anaerobic selenocysteine-containing dehydrogenase